MQGNDLGLFTTHRVVVILEGVLVDLPEPAYKGRIKKTKLPLPPAEEWAWQKMAVKYLNNTARMDSLAIDVVTFSSEEVAELAAEWFNNYYVEVSSTEYRDFDQYCESIQWAPEIDRIIDSNPSWVVCSKW
jgi:O-methyltransferase involved in polyketide biosynthesis